MWFITDFLERTARSFAQTVVKVALLEAEAQYRSMARERARRALAGGLILPDRALCVPPTLAMEPRVLVLPDAQPEPARALAHLVETAEAAEAERAAISSARPGDVIAAIADQAVATLEEPLTAAVDLAARPLPLGVRGEVVARYVAAFAAAGNAESAALIERMRKDKKVRVAELQLIAAAVLGGAVVHRKKVEHLDVLRRHLAPAGRARTATVPHAAYAAL